MGVSVSKMMCHRRIKCIDDDDKDSDPPDLEKQEIPTTTATKAIGFPVDEKENVEKIEVNPYRRVGTKRATVMACIWDDTNSLDTNQRINARSNLLNLTKTWVEMA